MNANFEKFKKNIKQDFLIKIIIQMRHEKISYNRAKMLAREIIEIFESGKEDGVFKSLSELTRKSPEIMDIFIKRVAEYDERERLEKLDEISVYLKSNFAKGGEN